MEPKEHIVKLWGKQRIRDNDIYRLMRYVLRVDRDGEVFLHNIVTGQLVALEQEEIEAMEALPQTFQPAMEQLVRNHYLVPEMCDEHQQVRNLRSILQMLDNGQRHQEIVHYTIFPTTACNARCYYCFEQGCEVVTMSAQTADDVIAFITQHCGGKSVRITWFGGEPTVATHRIDQICKGLWNNGVKYSSEMTTNGYLFDAELVEHAVNLWNLQKVMICFDGTEENYNKTKAFVNVNDNPYQRVLRNIGLLIEREIIVVVRMNYDLRNYNDFPGLLQEIRERYKLNPFVKVFAHPIVGEYADYDGRVRHGSNEWFEEKNVELRQMAIDSGLQESLQTDKLPHLTFICCQATVDSSVTITPQGYLVRCPEQFGKDEITGTVKEGITNPDLVKAWKQCADFSKCAQCVMYPYCLRASRCAVGDLCTSASRAVQDLTRAVCQRVESK